MNLMFLLCPIQNNIFVKLNALKLLLIACSQVFLCLPFFLEENITSKQAIFLNVMSIALLR